ncbi:MAG TPA: hypothetical protein VGV37_00305 [Aliidongia sp.]|uniref:hypothetical protein n=1 Tax=Aliidongia sp. TaxID=1914230 RepID=UPI002DDD2E09|nr:hypothetical protein [Aliidongia sp.]HEV2672948.1 hypothetical protein [Aliidongia sp.]
MTWLEIGLGWIVLSIGLPVLYGWRHAQMKDYRQKLATARSRFHRFHFGHPLPPTGH